MKKSGAYDAWVMMVTALPRGIAMFAVAVVGLCLGLTLAVVGIGIPILAGTMAWCERRLKEDQRRWGRWRRGEKKARESASEDAFHADPAAEGADERAASGWRSWFAAVSRARGYRAIFYNIAQFPLSIAVFCASAIIPAVVFGLLLEPVAYKVSMYLYHFPLYFNDDVMQMLLPPLSPFQRSLAVAGVGLFLLLFMAPLVRGFGRLYDGWVRFFPVRQDGIAAAFAAPQTQPPFEEEGQAAAQFH